MRHARKLTYLKLAALIIAAMALMPLAAEEGETILQEVREYFGENRNQDQNTGSNQTNPGPVLAIVAQEYVDRIKECLYQEVKRAGGILYDYEYYKAEELCLQREHPQQGFGPEQGKNDARKIYAAGIENKAQKLKTQASFTDKERISSWNSTFPYLLFTNFLAFASFGAGAVAAKAYPALGFTLLGIGGLAWIATIIAFIIYANTNRDKASQVEALRRDAHILDRQASEIRGRSTPEDSTQP